jgi:hypothetical protein
MRLCIFGARDLISGCVPGAILSTISIILLRKTESWESGGEYNMIVTIGRSGHWIRRRRCMER